jgi:hypothetical protein
MAAYGDVEGAFATMWHGYADLSFVVVNWLWLPVFLRSDHGPVRPRSSGPSAALD